MIKDRGVYMEWIMLPKLSNSQSKRIQDAMQHIEVRRNIINNMHPLTKSILSFNYYSKNKIELH